MIKRIKEICRMNASSLSKLDAFTCIQYLDTSNITHNEIDSVQKIEINNIPSRAQRKVNDKTIIYSTVRPNLCHFGILNNPTDNFIVSTGFVTLDIIDKTKFDPYYVYLLLTQPNVIDYLQTIAENSVSSYPSISPSDIGNLKFDFPNITTQKETSRVLRLLEQKISLNKSINRTLESLAKQLYDYWFVQFDFPDTNGKPYKSSGGPMEYNPILKRNIPKGWVTKELQEICDIVNGATPSTSVGNNYGGDIKWITPKDLSDQKQKFIFHGERNITQQGYDSCSTTLVPKGSILMSSRAPIGLFAIAQNEVCTNQGFKTFVPKNIEDSFYIYYYLNSHITQIEQLGSGTTFKEVSREVMKQYPVLFSINETLNTSFVLKLKPIFKQQANLQLESENLTTLRDELLPLLMNGQVTIK